MKKNTTPNATPNTARTRTRAPKPVAPVAPVADVMTPIVTMARTVTPANVIDVVGRACANHGVTARNVGRRTGMRVMAFQNHSFARNVEWQLDDCQLLAVWAIEFPAAIGRVFALNGRMGTPDGRAIADGIGIVRGVRSDYNRTGHGMATGKPAVESVAYGAKRFDVATPAIVPAPVVPAARTPRATRASKKTVAA